MHFGRLEDVDSVDFALPPDPVRTSRFLALDHPPATPTFYVGCPVWACRRWVGTLYPKGTRSGGYLEAYAQEFNTVEVNSTFYSPVDSATVAAWRQQVPPDFRFCPKVFRGITERLAAPTMPDAVARFCDSVRAFGPTLGLCFAQFSETFGPRSWALLTAFLSTWPEDVSLAIELRHPDWFRAGSLRDEAINLFYRRGVASVITDTAGRRDVLHLSLTQPKVMIRFQGNELHATDRVRLAAWAERLAGWSQHGLSEIYLFAHQPNEDHIPDTAALFRRELARHLAH